MKYKFSCIIFAVCLLAHRTMQPINFSVISSGFKKGAEVVKKGVEIAGHVATGVDMAMGIAGVGVTLWGSEGDKERFTKASNITSIVTSLARGDINSAQSAAEAVRGKKAESPIYEPLTEDALADADIVQVGAPTGRAIGDRTLIPLLEITPLRMMQKIVTIDDLKIAQFEIAKNQLVFLAKDLPQTVNQSKIYRLLNGVEVLFTVKSVQNNIANIIVKVIQGNNTNPLQGVPAMEIGDIKCSINELQKGLYIGTTNGELSIFFRDGNTINKTVLIKNMNQ